MYNSSIMKIVKVTPKFKMHRMGFKYALRFDQYDYRRASRKLYDMYGDGGPYNRYYTTMPGRRDAQTRCFLRWIYLREEADVTLLQLAGAFDAD
jgi:hypothetical protein